MNDFGQAHEGGSMPVGTENATTAGDRETAPTAVARLEALIRVSEALRAYRDRDTLFHGLARELRSVVPFNFLGLALYDEQTNAVQRYVLQTTGEPVAPPVQLPIADSLAHWIVQHQKPLVIPDVENETRFQGAMAYFRRPRRTLDVFSAPDVTAEPCRHAAGRELRAERLRRRRCHVPVARGQSGRARD